MHGKTLHVREPLSQEEYCEAPEILEELFEHVALNLKDACLEGVRLRDGSKLHLCTIAIKGDWPFLVPCTSLAHVVNFGLKNYIYI